MLSQVQGAADILQLPDLLFLQLGEVLVRILVEVFQARFAAEFHGGAIVIVEVGFAHFSEFLSRYHAYLQGVVVSGFRGGLISFPAGFSGIARATLQSAPKQEGKACDQN